MISLKEKILLTINPGFNFLMESGGKTPPVQTPIWIIKNSFPDITDRSFNDTLFKLEADGLIGRSFVGKAKYYYLTQEGVLKLTSNIKYFRFMRELSDGSLRLLIFDIPETDRKLRDELRLVLYELGFRLWQRSVYVTPFKIEQEIEKKARHLGIFEKINLMTINKFNGDFNKLIWDLWGLRLINEGYNIFISQADQLLTVKISNYQKWIERCQKLRFEYFEMQCLEPFLPKELSGKEYKFEEANKYYLDLGERLIKVLERV